MQTTLWFHSKSKIGLKERKKEKGNPAVLLLLPLWRKAQIVREVWQDTVRAFSNIETNDSQRKQLHEGQTNKSFNLFLR